ncbi:hypothetical protein P4S72_02345 [Vibrio sp. PP-XX7]
MRTIVNDVVALMSGSAMAKGLNIELDIAADIPDVYLGDSTRSDKSCSIY